MNGDTDHAAPAPAAAAATTAVTKKVIRINIWKQMRKNSAIRVPSFSFNRIPWIIGTEDPVEQLKEMSLFKSAKNILVGYDKAQESVKLACLQAGKTLYVQVPRLQKSLMTCLKMKEDATDKNFQEALTLKGLEEYGTLVGLDDDVSIDLVIIGSIAVARNGIRIGRGGGYVDMYLSILQYLKIITPSTLIVTTVHDSQILDTIPNDIIGAHDFPVDVIVTPTQVIHTSYDRPSSISWNMISQHQIHANGLLSQIREKEIAAGNECVLKSVDETERGENGAPRRYFRGRWGNRRWQGQQHYRRSQTNGVHSESENHEGLDGESGHVDKQDRGHRRKFNYRRKRQMSAKDSIKSTFRDKAWYSLKSSRVLTTPRYPYYRIPGFRGSQDAAQLLRQQDSFKNAKSVLVSIEKTHEGIRLACLEDGKTLYVLNPKPQKELIIRIDAPKITDDEENKIDLKSITNGSGIEKYGCKLDLSEPVHIDLWVVGSVAVSKDGCHIGKGNGSLDICYGFLADKKAITPDTKIFTTVHDDQVFETLPAEIKCDHDIPVNVIVTPTQVIDISCERNPPTGIVWELLIERVVTKLPFLNEYRQKEMLAGKSCVLKVEDPDEYKKRGSNDHSESEPNEITEGGENGLRPRKKRIGQPWKRQHRRNHDGDNDESGNISPDTTSHRPKRRMQFRKPKLVFDFSIKLTSIDRTARIRDLKTALNDRNVKPNSITWKGSKGFCFLHFQKGTTSTGLERETELTADSILGALAELTLQPTPDLSDNSSQIPPNKVSAEIAKSVNNRSEGADETAV